MEVNYMKKLILDQTVESVNFKLWTDNNKNSYQTVRVTNVKTDVEFERKIIAPVDFFTVISAITCNDNLADAVSDFADTWCGDVLEHMVNLALKE